MTLHPHLTGWVVVLDIETTGLPHELWSEAIELGAVLLDPKGIERAAFSSLVRPRHGIPMEAAAAMAVNGIDPLWLCQAPRDFKVMACFEDWKNAWDIPRPHITSFNRAFDLYFYRAMGGSNGVWGHACLQAAMGELFAETKGWSPRARADGTAPVGPSLATSAAHFGVAQPSAHRALVDARTAADVLRGLRSVSQ